MRGKVKAALDLRLLSDSSSGGVLSLDEHPEGSQKTVFDILQEKHPDAQGVLPDAVVSEPNPSQAKPWHPVQFDRLLNGSRTPTAALRTQGEAGLSGIDAKGWRRLCTGFHGASRDLCNSVAQFARRMATYVDPAGRAAYIACRLINLDKNPGVRPTGIWETVRRIVRKAIMYIVGDDVQEAAGPLQLCAGQQAGFEAGTSSACYPVRRCLRTLQMTGYSLWTHRTLSTA